MPIDRQKVLKRTLALKKSMAVGEKKKESTPLRDLMSGRAMVEGVKVLGRGIGNALEDKRFKNANLPPPTTGDVKNWAKDMFLPKKPTADMQKRQLMRKMEKKQMLQEMKKK